MFQNIPELFNLKYKNVYQIKCFKNIFLNLKISFKTLVPTNIEKRKVRDELYLFIIILTRSSLYITSFMEVQEGKTRRWRCRKKYPQQFIFEWPIIRNFSLK